MRHWLTTTVVVCLLTAPYAHAQGVTQSSVILWGAPAATKTAADAAKLWQARVFIGESASYTVLTGVTCGALQPPDAPPEIATCQAPVPPVLVAALNAETADIVMRLALNGVETPASIPYRVDRKLECANDRTTGMPAGTPMTGIKPATPLGERWANASMLSVMERVVFLRRKGWRVEWQVERWAAPLPDNPASNAFYHVGGECLGVIF